MHPPDALRLVGVVDEAAATREDRLEALLLAGVTALWLRMSDATGRAVYRRARALRALTTRTGRALLVGDRVDVALAVEADGVQLGHRAPPPDRLRPHFAGRLGVSCHDEEELVRAERAGADHVVLSPVFPVPGKGRPLGVERFGRLARACPLPVVALGGIDEATAAAVLEAGAAGVAAVRALADPDDPGRTVRALLGEVTSR
jgi:thiamine-phosphate pyrophosphorylase